MRFYVSRNDLVSILTDLLEKKDPAVKEVYKEVMLYRFSKNPPNPKKVEKMLRCPLKIVLSCLNIFVLVLGVILLHQLGHLNPFLLTNISWILIFIACLECGHLIYLIRLSGKFIPYVLLDELIARKILTISLCERSTQSSHHSNTAK